MPPNNEPQTPEPNKADEWIVREAQGDPELIDLIKRREAIYGGEYQGVGEDRGESELQELHDKINARKTELDKGKTDKT